jgi:cyclic beta-1,2-glucan glucanotransferase
MTDFSSSAGSDALLHLDACIPHAWRRFDNTFRYHASRYEIAVENPNGVTRGISMIEVDGTPVELVGGRAPLTSDGATHRTRLALA